MIGTSVNILLIEDDEIDVINVRRAVRKCGMSLRLQIAGGGREALRILRREGGLAALPWQRRVILLDLDLPRTGGIDFLCRLRADPVLRTLPVVAMTTSDADRDHVVALGLRVAGYVAKPVTMGAFVEIIRNLHGYGGDSQMPVRKDLSLASYAAGSFA